MENQHQRTREYKYANNKDQHAWYNWTSSFLVVTWGKKRSYITSLDETELSLAINERTLSRYQGKLYTLSIFYKVVNSKNVKM